MILYIYRNLKVARPACPFPWNQDIDSDFNLDAFVRGYAKPRDRVRDMLRDAGTVAKEKSFASVSRRFCE